MKHKPNLFQALICLAPLFSWIFVGLFVLNISLQSIVLLSISWVMLNSLFVSPDLDLLKSNLKASLQKSAGVLFIFLLIGVVISAFIISGAIPTLIYYGLNLISPTYFLPVAMFLCSVMSLAIGTSWGTIGTMGVALMGLATLFNVHLPMAAGAIVSGAYFGDKLSPLSDTTILSALSADVDIYTHMKGLSWSLIPAFLLSMLIFYFLGLHFSPPVTELYSQIHAMQHALTSHFQIGWVSMLPLLCMLILSILKKPAEISMLASTLCALILAMLVQHMSLETSLNSLCSGPILQASSSELLNKVLHHGGIQNMLNSLSLTILILTLGGLLESYHFINVLFEPIINGIKTRLSLLTATLLACVMSNMLLGEAYLSILLMSRAFKPAFQKCGLDNCALSNSLEEGATFSTPLIPWTTSGIFISTTLGVASSSYIYWSIFNWIAPMIFILFSGLPKILPTIQNLYVSKLTESGEL